MSRPYKYGESPSGAVESEDWDTMVDRVNDLPAIPGDYNFKNGITYGIWTDGTYFYANDSYHTLYGGSGDAGSTDGHDVNAVFNAAITALNAAGGGTLGICYAEYTGCSNIKPLSNVHIIGMGGRPKLTGTGSNYAILENRDGSAGSPLTNIKIANLELDGSSMTGEKGLDLTFIQNSEFHSLYIHDTYASGFGVDHYQNVFIHHNICKDCGTNAYLGHNGFGLGAGGFSTGSEPVIVTDNIAIGCYNNGFLIEKYTSKPEYIIFSNNIASGNYHGYMISGGGNIHIIGNIDKSSTSDGMYFNTYGSENPSDIIIANNTITGSGANGINIPTTYLETFKISGNHISTATERGICAFCDYSEINDNTIELCGYDGIKIQAYLANIQSTKITNNVIRDCGTSSTSGARNGIKFYAGSGRKVDRALILGNQIYDNQGSQTQQYALNFEGDIDGVSIFSNDLSGNSVGAILTVGWTGSNMTVRNNLGYVTENGGTSAIASGQTHVHVPHGCSYTPSLQDITITPTGTSTADPTFYVWASDPTSSEFQVHCTVDPGVLTLPFAWAVRKI